MHMQPLAINGIRVGKTPGEQDTMYEIDLPTSASSHTLIEFRQDPVDPSTFRRYINGVRR